jgi:hypothetical protein
MLVRQGKLYGSEVLKVDKEEYKYPSKFNEIFE